jgi:hypothetical protein
VPINAPWYEKFRSELLTFPTGRNDDQVDALGLVGQLIDKMVAGMKPKPMTKPKRDRYSRDDDAEEAVNWKVT